LLFFCFHFIIVYNMCFGIFLCIYHKSWLFLIMYISHRLVHTI
jgi:hypothetical protein